MKTIFPYTSMCFLKCAFQKRVLQHRLQTYSLLLKSFLQPLLFAGVFFLAQRTEGKPFLSPKCEREPLTFFLNLYMWPPDGAKHVLCILKQVWSVLKLQLTDKLFLEKKAFRRLFLCIAGDFHFSTSSTCFFAGFLKDVTCQSQK